MTVPGGCNPPGGRPWLPLTVDDLWNGDYNWVAARKCSYQANNQTRPVEPVSGINSFGTDSAATPIISYPPNIRTMEQAWEHCSEVYSWTFYESPIPLKYGKHLHNKFVPFVHTSVGAMVPLRESTDSTQQPAIVTFHTSIVRPLDLTEPLPVTKAVTAQPGAHVTADISATITVTAAVKAQPAEAKPLLGEPIIPHATEGAVGGDPFPVMVGPLLGASDGEGVNRHSSSAAPVIVATAGHQPVYVLPQGDVSIAGSVVEKGGPAATVDDVRVSVDADSIYVDSSKFARPTPPPGLGPAPSSVGSEKLQVNSNGELVLAGKTLPPGAQTTIDGSRIIFDTDRVVVGSSTYAAPIRNMGSANSDNMSPAERKNPPKANRQPTIQGHQVEAAPDGAIMIDGSSLAEGQQRSLDGALISVGPSNIILGSSIYIKPTVTDEATWQRSADWDVIIDAKHTILPVLPMGLVQDSAILSEESGFQTTVQGIPISVGSNIIAVGTSTYAVPLPTDPSISLGSNGAVMFDGKILPDNIRTTISGTPISVGDSIIVLAGKTYSLPVSTNPTVSRASNGALEFDGVTLTEGAQESISGATVSLGSDSVVIGGKAYGLPGLPLPTNVAIASAPSGEVIFDGKTLSSGMQTISGTVVSVDSDIIVIGSKAQTLPEATTAADTGLGALIASMYEYDPSVLSSVSSTPSAGPSAASGNGSSSSAVELASFTGGVGGARIEALDVGIGLLGSMWTLVFI